MKYLLVLGVVLFGIWLWRHNRATEARERDDARRAAAQRTPSAAPLVPTDMVACAHCGLHLPLTDAVQGVQGRYCTDAHRRTHES
jgi:uncharacterized protein